MDGCLAGAGGRGSLRACPMSLALARWLADYKEQVFLFTRNFAVSWTNNVSERGAKAAKRHQAVSGYWHSLATLQRWCRIKSYLDSAAAHGVTALDAICGAITGNPWLPPLPALPLASISSRRVLNNPFCLDNHHDHVRFTDTRTAMTALRVTAAMLIQIAVCRPV